MKPARKNVAPAMPLIAILFALSLAIYLLGVGPVVWLGNHPNAPVPEALVSFLGLLYLPLGLLADAVEPIGRALEWYIELWC